MPNQKRVTVSWVEDMTFEGKTESGNIVRMASGGGGPSPMEMLLLSLAGCTAVDVISILQKQRQDVSGLDVHVEGRRAADHPRRYTDIAIEFVVRGRNVSPQALARAIELSETKYCSVAASLNPDIRWVRTQRIVEEE